MEKDKLYTMQRSQLRKRSVQGIGLLERLPLICRGRGDGRQGLPRESAQGQWESPFIAREVGAYNEFASKMWAHFQLHQEDSYHRLASSLDTIAQTEAALAQAREALEDASCQECGTFRKPGEAALPDSQVRVRREKEHAKSLAPVKARVASIQAQLDEQKEDVSTVYNQILEAHTTMSMVIEKQKQHLEQRLAVYWAAALGRHPENARMPAIPDIPIPPAVEEAYLQKHEMLMARARALMGLGQEEKEAV